MNSMGCVALLIRSIDLVFFACFFVLTFFNDSKHEQTSGRFLSAKFPSVVRTRICWSVCVFSTERQRNNHRQTSPQV